MPYRRTIQLQMMTMAFGVSLLIACGESDAGPPFMQVCADTPTSCFDPAFESETLRTKLVGCAGDPAAGSCHSSGSTQSTMELDLTDPATTVQAALAPLVDRLSLSGTPFIDSECIEESFLLRKLTNDPGFGSRMPLAPDTPWTNDEVECFRSYLTQTFMQAEAL